MNGEGQTHTDDSWIEAIRQVVFDAHTGPRIRSDQPFADSFIHQHTVFDSLEEFRQNSPWSLEGSMSLAEVPEGELDRYISSTTDFETFEEMQEQAAEEALIEFHLA